MIEKSSNGGMSVFAFDLDSVVILLGYPRYTEHIKRLHRHHWKVKNSSLPAAEPIVRPIACVGQRRRPFRPLAHLVLEISGRDFRWVELVVFKADK